LLAIGCFPLSIIMLVRRKKSIIMLSWFVLRLDVSVGCSTGIH